MVRGLGTHVQVEDALHKVMLAAEERGGRRVIAARVRPRDAAALKEMVVLAGVRGPADQRAWRVGNIEPLNDVIHFSNTLHLVEIVLLPNLVEHPRAQASRDALNGASTSLRQAAMDAGGNFLERAFPFLDRLEDYIVAFDNDNLGREDSPELEATREGLRQRLREASILQLDNEITISHVERTVPEQALAPVPPGAERFAVDGLPEAFRRVLATAPQDNGGRTRSLIARSLRPKDAAAFELVVTMAAPNHLWMLGNAKPLRAMAEASSLLHLLEFALLPVVPAFPQAPALHNALTGVATRVGAAGMEAGGTFCDRALQIYEELDRYVDDAKHGRLGDFVARTNTVGRLQSDGTVNIAATNN